MNKSEAYDLLAKKLAELLYKTDLAPFVEAGSVDRFEVRGGSGTIYQVEMRFGWVDKESGKIQIIGSIDDGGKPLVQALPWSLPGFAAKRNGAANPRPSATHLG